MGRFLGAGQFRSNTIPAATEVYNVTTATQLGLNSLYYVNTTAATVTLTLPRFPVGGNFVDIIDISGTWATNNCIVLPSGDGSTVSGFSDNLTLNLGQANIRLQYSPGTNNWVITQLV